MAEAGSRFSGLPPTRDGLQTKKRRVRKGTQSCWECKRRKSKCSLTVSTAAGSTCDGCFRRGTPCISQEYPEDPASNRQRLGDRLGRVERLLASRLDKDTTRDGIGNCSGSPDARSNAPGVVGSIPRPTPDPKTYSLSQIVPAALQSSQDLVNALFAAWPSQDDLELILSTPMRSSGLFHGVICVSYSQFMSQPLSSPRELLQLPPRGSHPVLVARKLLTLGSFLQSFTPEASEVLDDRLSISLHDLMTRAVETAVRLVTSNDDLIDSVEGIECIMMESMYHNNAGSLRRAYLSMRRALTIYQMIGLDGSVTSPSPRLKFLEPESRKRISSQHMWFRILQSDGYLSLMLGLPRGSHDDSFATPEVLEECMPMERMERILTLAGAQILLRNHSRSNKDDLKVTQKIDTLLLDGAASLPPKWWLPPELTSSEDDDMDALQNTLRVMNQLTHYHLLQRLHLPYLLLSSTDRAYEYSRITAITASRELLSRFLSFRRSWPITGCFCRGVDFLAFISSTALCLGHISARIHAHDDNAVFQSLGHQRLGDRGMMESMLEIMEQVESAEPTDRVAIKIARILRHLLAIEAEVANGGTYQAQLCPGGEGEDLGCDGKMDNAGAGLEISVPHLGTIKLKRRGIRISGSAQTSSTTRGDHGGTQSRPTEDTTDHSRSHAGDMTQPTHSGIFTRSFDEERSVQDGPWFIPGMESEDWDLQGVDIAFFDSLFPKSTDNP